MAELQSILREEIVVTFSVHIYTHLYIYTHYSLTSCFVSLRNERKIIEMGFRSSCIGDWISLVSFGHWHHMMLLVWFCSTLLYFVFCCYVRQFGCRCFCALIAVTVISVQATFESHYAYEYSDCYTQFGISVLYIDLNRISQVFTMFRK